MTQRPGWTIYYLDYYKPKDQLLPEVKIEQEIPITKLSTGRKYTKHAPRFNASSLIRKMEQEKIGTKATRSNIVETLYRRGYIRGQQIAVTGLGENIIETLMRYSPEIIEVKLTRDLEEELEEIEAGKKGSDTVFNDVVEELKPILAQFKLSEEEIGKTISNTIKEKASNNSKYACKVCHRDKLDGSVFCARHTVAYVNIEAGFQKWRYALGYQWREYLEKLSKNTGTGVYAKEIIKDIIG